jgi:hypothetical protein
MKARAFSAERLEGQVRPPMANAVRQAVRRYFLCLFACLFSALVFVSCGKPSSTEAPLAITHATLIDATGAAPRPETTVLIEQQRIKLVTPSGSTSLPANTLTLDATGKFLIPGLVDSHVHLTAAGEPFGSRQFVIPLLVANGITTVRDMGGKVEYLTQLRSEIAEGKLLAPQIFFTGPYLDGDPAGYQPSIVVRNPSDARDAVNLLFSQRVDFIKTQSNLDRDAYFAIAEEAKLKGIRFVGHVPDRISALEASNAGQYSIEHLTGILLGCSSKENELRREEFLPDAPHDTVEQRQARVRAWQRKLLDSYSEEKAAALFRALLMNGTWQVPTFPILVHLGFMTPQTDLASDSQMKYISQSERRIWSEGVRERLQNRTQPDFALRAEIVQRSLQVVGKMQKAGVLIMAGTDTPAPNVFPGSSLHEDMAYLVEAGFTPMQALQAATRSPAEFLGKLGSQGTIEPGKFADLVLLNANPLEDIHNTQKIHAVVLRGRLLDRSALDRLLLSVEHFAETH